MKEKYFLKVITRLRLVEEILLLGHVLTIPAPEAEEVKAFLLYEYEREQLDYPYVVPAFDEAAALWAAQTIYMAAQLILYRQDEPEELEKLLPLYKGAQTESAILSADLCLRFLPNMIYQLTLIDPADPLVALLEKIIHQWHYSGINYNLNIEALDFKLIQSNDCLRQLYLNRIIEYKNKKLAKHDQWLDGVKASLSIFSKEYWADF